MDLQFQGLLGISLSIYQYQTLDLPLPKKTTHQKFLQDQKILQIFLLILKTILRLQRFYFRIYMCLNHYIDAIDIFIAFHQLLSIVFVYLYPPYFVGVMEEESDWINSTHPSITSIFKNAICSAKDLLFGASSRYLNLVKVNFHWLLSSAFNTNPLDGKSSGQFFLSSANN